MPKIMPLSDRLNSELKLVSAIVEGEASAFREGWVSAKDAKRKLQ